MALTEFPDVSHYQAGMSLTGSPAAIAKCTQGTFYLDPSYANFKAQALALAIPFAAYHWVDGSDLQAQAARCYSVAGRTPVMWDCEAAGATVPRIADLTARYRKLGGTASLVYLPHWWWQQLGSPDLRPLAALGLSLVSSSYPPGGYSDNGPGWAPYGGMTPVVWQYTDKPHDMNAFKGTAAELAALFAGSHVPPALVKPKGKRMRGYKASDNATVYVGDGVQCRTNFSWKQFCFMVDLGLLEPPPAGQTTAGPGKYDSMVWVLPAGEVLNYAGVLASDGGTPGAPIDLAAVEAAAEKGAKEGIEGATIHTA
jgi:hypothetical protein